MALLEVSRLEAFYGQTQVLRGLSFELEEGGVTTILGANGAGKTTRAGGTNTTTSSAAFPPR